jgi:hypothetical protein
LGKRYLPGTRPPNGPRPPGRPASMPIRQAA